MQLRKATRLQTKLKMGLAGPSGSGKTYSALLLASGLTTWDKIAVIDTEHGSADLYSHLGDFSVITLSDPFTPERYIEAIKTCEDAGMEAIIIDSMTHEWDGKGGILEMHDAMPGNSYTNWAKFTPRHNAFIEKILQSNAHIIATLRAKQDYILVEKNGKQVPEKVGLRAITREGIEYELTLTFDINIKHQAVSSKDRTGLFVDKPDFVITADTGKLLLDWTQTGAKRYIAPEDRITADTIAKIKGYNQDLSKALAFFGAETVEELKETEGQKIIDKLQKITDKPQEPPQTPPTPPQTPNTPPQPEPPAPQAQAEAALGPNEVPIDSEVVNVDEVDAALTKTQAETAPEPPQPVAPTTPAEDKPQPKLVTKGGLYVLTALLNKKAKDFSTPVEEITKLILVTNNVDSLEKLTEVQANEAVNYLTNMHPKADETKNEAAVLSVSGGDTASNVNPEPSN